MGDRSRFDHVPEQPACLKERRQEQKQPRIPSARAHAVCPSVGWRQTLPEQPACLKARRQEQKQPRIPSARARMPCSRPLQGGRSKSNRAFQARARACRVPARWLETNPPRAAGMFKSKAAGAKATAHSKRARAHAVFPPVGWRQTLPERPACLKARRQEQKQPRIPSARARMPCSRPLVGDKPSPSGRHV
ncbi:hypothetical protein GPALN_014524 [Globodera pallida]|nr:hypothetical protein GPALN_014524 [Globodera pallida]